ncbi:hypothetical protein [Arvimicrobium flavum]|uniref:hypothetical protein n=1 Tax=Arvimicrobium flavum TaxID=3393320 RepID=UPI00237BD299|nr:hypothetical protein [Mesorhizobium shangrilense]
MSTFEEIDRAYLQAARVVERYGERFMPLFDRMADEREKALAREDRLAQALKRLRPSRPAEDSEAAAPLQQRAFDLLRRISQRASSDPLGFDLMREVDAVVRDMDAAPPGGSQPARRARTKIRSISRKGRRI